MREFKNGEELREALATTLRPGDKVIYHGIVHRVIDAGDQGLRVACDKQSDAPAA